jgi:hypothetical protein
VIAEQIKVRRTIVALAEIWEIPQLGTGHPAARNFFLGLADCCVI